MYAFLEKWRAEADLNPRLSPHKARYSRLTLKREIRVLYETYAAINSRGIEVGSPEFRAEERKARARYPTDESIANDLIHGRKVEFSPQNDGIDNGHHD